jgi:hypothetical protein
MKALIITILTLSLLASASAMAASIPQENEKLEATAQIALRASSPDASFGTKGEKIGWIAQGDAVKVLSSKQISTVFGFEVWVEVQSLSDGRVKGWIFNGMSAEVLKGQGKLHEMQAQAMVAQR